MINIMVLSAFRSAFLACRSASLPDCLGQFNRQAGTRQKTASHFLPALPDRFISFSVGFSGFSVGFDKLKTASHFFTCSA
jgi:hypothetical protein